MEPERKIEKLLRAYARRRRAQAGDPLKLHPATRRLLQGEIARNAPRPDEADESLTLWELFRQRWAVLLGFALMVFFGASLFLPALSSAKKKAQTLSALNNLKQIGLAAQMAAEENNGKLPASLDALTNGYLTDKVLAEPESGKRFIYLAGGENLDGLPSNSVLAYSPTDRKGRAVLLADGRVKVVNGEQFSEMTNRGLAELAFAKDSARRQPAEAPTAITLPSGNAAVTPPISEQSKSTELGMAFQNAGELVANPPAAPAPTVDDRLATAHGAAGNYSTAQNNSVQFASTISQKSALGLQNNFKNTAAPAKTAFVLAHFQVQQNGNTIRVVDQDGSVYEGSLLPENAVAQSGPAQAATLAPPVAAPTQADQEKMIANRSESQTAQNYFFRVRGMNQTLKQTVVFAGNLLAISNATTNSQQSLSNSAGFGGGGVGGLSGGQLQSALTNQLPWSSSRIAGTAVIADTNDIEINAVPLSP